MTHPSKLVVIPLALALATAARGSAQAPPPSLRDFLARDGVLSAAQIAAVERGDVVVKTLPTGDERDVAVMGLVRADRSRRFVIGAIRARGAGRAFGTPPTLDDVADMHLTSDDLNELSRCQPNACNFKLPAAGMAALSAIVSSNAADAARRAEDYLRRRMVEYVAAYRQRGNAAMIVYDDLGSVQSSSSFDAMLRDSSHIFHVAPTLAGFLLDFPRAWLPGATNLVFWTVDALPRIRPVLRIVHEVTYTPTEVPGATVIAAKQLYADHYFEAGLEVLTAIDDSLSGFAGGRYGTALVVVRHYRFDHLPSGGVLNLRRRVIDGLRDGVTNDLRRLRGDNER
jgi:hypothetical protein